MVDVALVKIICLKKKQKKQLNTDLIKKKWGVVENNV